MSTLIDEIRADLLELKESYHVMLGLERQRLAHQAGYCRGRGWSDLAAQFDDAGQGDDLAAMMEEANALIKLVMERITGVESDKPVTRLPVVAVAHLSDGTTREYRGTMKVTQEMIDKASADVDAAGELMLKQYGFTREMIDEARDQVESVTGPPAQGSGAASVTGLTGVTGKGNGNEGNSGKDGSQWVRRHILVVLDHLLEVIPLEELELRSSLNSHHVANRYRAPEDQEWAAVAASLELHLEGRDEPWVREVAEIWTGKKGTDMTGVTPVTAGEADTKGGGL